MDGWMSFVLGGVFVGRRAQALFAQPNPHDWDLPEGSQWFLSIKISCSSCRSVAAPPTVKTTVVAVDV